MKGFVFVLGFVLGLKSYAYTGHGAETVSKEEIAKFAAPALDPALSRKIQAYLDVRSPGMGLLHPNGQILYFSWRVTGTPQAWKLDRKQNFPIQLTGGEDTTQVLEVTPDGKWLVLSRDRNGEENPGIYLQDAIHGGELISVQHTAKVQSHFQFVSRDSKYIYFRANDIKPDSFAIYRYNIKSKEKELLFSEPGYWVIIDSQKDGRLLLAKMVTNVASETYEWNPQTKALTPIIGQNEKEEYEVLYSAQEGEFLVLTNKLSDFKRIYKMSLKDKKLKPITAEKSYDIDGFAMDPVKKHLVYTVNDRGYSKLYALDTQTLKEISLPRFPQAEQTYAGASTWDGSNIMIGVETAKSPRLSYSYNWNTKKLTQWVLPSTPEVDTKKFAAPTLEEYTARDGTKIPMFVRRPEGCDKKVCPVVVHFHGGPEGQSTPGFRVASQFFIDAGFIFVEPNVRGSTGYGKKWLHIDDGPKRLDVITDIEDAALYIKKNWAKDGVVPKVGVMGWSYGGYSTLYAMTKFAGAFDVGVANVGMSNLLTFLNNTAPYRRALRTPEYGDPEKDKEALVKLSPITYLDQIKAPLLIIQGAQDPRVPVGEALQIHKALLAKKIPSQLIIFADEGHGTQKRSNNVLEYGHMVQFFEKHLK